MFHANKAGTSRVRKLISSASVVALSLGLALVGGPAVGAPGDFEVDGDLTVNNGGYDWTSFTNYDTDGDASTGFVMAEDLASGKGDNAFGQGTKEDDLTPTVVFGSIPPNKSDLSHFYIANDEVGGKKLLYLAWERTNTLGSANMDFEINQEAQPDMTTAGEKNVVRTPGDLLVRYDFSGGGTKPTLTLVKWLTGGDDGATADDCNANNSLPCWGAVPADDETDGVDDEAIDLSDLGYADGQVNQPCDPADKKCTDTTPNPLTGDDMPQATFGEAVINMTDAGLFPAGECKNFGSAYLKSRSSDSFNAETKDFIAPEEISINNCGKLTIEKVTLGGFGKFDYTSTTLSPGSFSLTTTAAGASNAVSTGSAYHGILAGTYDVTEAAKTGWDLTGASCVNNADSSTHASTLTSMTLSVAIAADDDVTCTFTNTKRASLTFKKKVVTASGQTDTTLFTFTPSTSLSGETVPTDGNFQLKDGDSKSYGNLTPGTYSASEANPAPAYDLTGRSCVYTGTSNPKTFDSSTARTIGVTLAAGEDVTCTFTNTKRGSLKIKKSDDGSPASALDGAVFTLYNDVDPNDGATEHVAADTATSYTCTTGAGSEPSGECNIANLPLGDYWVVETTTPTGYSTAADQHITVTAGSSVTLNFTDKRKFTVITLVCQNSDDSLYPSTIKLDDGSGGTDTKTSLSATLLAQFNSDNGTNITEEQLCSLLGAKFSPRHHGSYDGKVIIPQ